MGLGSIVKRVAGKIDATARGIEKRPFSSQSLKAALPLAVGVPFSVDGALSVGRKFGRQLDGQNRTVISQARKDKAIAQGVRDLKAPQQKKNRQLIGEVGLYVVIVAAVVVTCYISLGTACATAVGVGITAAGLVNSKEAEYKAEVKAKAAAKKAAIAANQPDNVYTPPGDAGVGGAASELASGDFSGVGESLDWNTLAGKKTWLAIGGGVAALAGLYYGVKYLRK
jgi:hypothetical protein